MILPFLTTGAYYKPDIILNLLHVVHAYISSSQQLDLDTIIFIL